MISSRPRTGAKILGQLLLEAGSLSAPELDAVLEEQMATGSRLGEIAVRHGYASEIEVARALAAQLNLPCLEGWERPDGSVLTLVDPATARARRILPLGVEGRSVRVAMADPLDLAVLDDLRFRCGRHIEPVVAPPSVVEAGIAEAYGGELSALIHELPSELVRLREDDDDALEAAARAAPVVRLVDHILTRAVEERGSDVHIEHDDDRFEVRYRVDGLLRPVADLPAASHRAVLSRLKIMAGMDISVRRRPQDGGLPYQVRGREYTLRVSTLPTNGGREKCVVRVLDPARAPTGLDGLGFEESDLERMRALVQARQGVVLAAGPTGSGKSSTLYGALTELDRTVNNVVTLEDPVEYRIAGVTQVQMDPRSGLTFPAALRAVLRQDPDVIMVGEIRDPETAEIAMSAAITGHLVLSTIHTVDAPSAIMRLLDMGVPGYLVASGLTGVVAQRLVRTVCRACGGRGGACRRCAGGYYGRTGVFQVLTLDDGIRAEIVGGASLQAIRGLAQRGGMGTMSGDARRKAAEGMTTPHEVGRVLREEGGTLLPCEGCGGEVPHDAVGCPWCGAPRARLCACGSVLKKGWRFCPTCLRTSLA